MFQFISAITGWGSAANYSNTSHVPIYPIVQKVLPYVNGYSNTSHVPIYRIIRKSQISREANSNMMLYNKN